jgi:hypothetical protein
VASASWPASPTGSPVAGRSDRRWEVAWVRWRLSLPIHAAHTERTCITAGERAAARVWFLDGDGLQPDAVTRTCSVPAGRYLMFGPWTVCSNVGPRRVPARRLVGCARRLWRRFVLGLDVTVDGAALKPAGHDVTTWRFRFRMPAHANVLDVPGATRGRAAVRARVVLLAPLVAGAHTIVERERDRGLTLETTWRIHAG